MLGGECIVDKREKFNEIFFVFIVVVSSIFLAKITLFDSRLTFSVPFIYYCFLRGKMYGIISFLSFFLFMINVDKRLLSILVIIFASFYFVKSLLRCNCGKLINILSFYNFIIVFVCSLVEKYLAKGNFYYLNFFVGVISYWFMRYLCEFYFSCKGNENLRLDSRLSCFFLVLLGLIAIGANVEFSFINISFVFLLVLLFIGVRIGIEVGAVYGLVMLGIMYFLESAYFNLFLLSATFLIAFFLSKVSKWTMFFTYISGISFIFYFENINYLESINYFVAGFVFFCIPSSFLRWLSCKCYGNDAYIKKVCEDNKRFNCEIANKIVQMEEVFSLVCEKIDIKERIKKNDKKLIAEEVNIFDNLLKSFSSKIKDAYNFDGGCLIERELYKYDIDLLNFNESEDVFKNKIIQMDVRCEKKEIYTLINPVVNKIMNNQFKVVSVKFNDVFSYYSVALSCKKKVNFKYGIAQKSLDKRVCGDSYLVYENNSVFVFAISDGMGTGLVAKNASKLTLDLFKKFMDIGFSLNQTLKSLNNILKNKFEKESYSTLDLFVCDKLNNKYYFCKNGASNSYLFSNQKSVIRGNTLPIGIVENMQFKIEEIAIKKGDCVVMTSDGIGEIMIEKIKINNVQKISERIVNQEDVINDDKTVFVIKIC